MRHEGARERRRQPGDKNRLRLVPINVDPCRHHRSVAVANPFEHETIVLVDQTAETEQRDEQDGDRDVKHDGNIGQRIESAHPVRSAEDFRRFDDAHKEQRQRHRDERKVNAAETQNGIENDRADDRAEDSGNGNRQQRRPVQTLIEETRNIAADAEEQRLSERDKTDRGEQVPRECEKRNRTRNEHDLKPIQTDDIAQQRKDEQSANQQDTRTEQIDQFAMRSQSENIIRPRLDAAVQAFDSKSLSHV